MMLAGGLGMDAMSVCGAIGVRWHGPACWRASSWAKPWAARPSSWAHWY